MPHVDRSAVWKAITVEVPLLVTSVSALLAELDAAMGKAPSPDRQPPP
jgi:uncharacterized protein with HEPN domain